MAAGWNAARTARKVAVTEIACALRVTERAAETLMEEARTLVASLPSTLDALSAGRLSYAHASILAEESWSLPVVTTAEVQAADPTLATDAAQTLARELTTQVVAEFEATTLPVAETATASRFRHRVRQARERMHPATIETRNAAKVADRHVRLEPARDGMAWLSAYLPAEDAYAAYGRLTDIAHTLSGDGEDRTLPQRRADIFRDLLFDGVVTAVNPTTGAGIEVGRGIRATVHVTVPVLRLAGHDTIQRCELEGYGPISDTAAMKLLGTATSLKRLLTHPETGAVLSVGRDSYAIPKDLRTWLRVRDGTCRFPGCGRTAATSEIDHTLDWQHGGDTSHDNLAHLCQTHHQLKHHTRWRVHHAGGGTLDWTAPSGHTYRTHPERQLLAG